MSIQKRLVVAVTACSILLPAFPAYATGIHPVPVVPIVTKGGAGAGVWALGGCVILIIIAAHHKGRTEKRELTTEEALTCGLLALVTEEKKKKKVYPAYRRAKHFDPLSYK